MVRLSGAAVVIAMIVAVGLLMASIRRAVLPLPTRLLPGSRALRDDHNSSVRLEGLGPDFEPVGAVFNEVVNSLRDSALHTGSVPRTSATTHARSPRAPANQAAT